MLLSQATVNVKMLTDLEVHKKVFANFIPIMQNASILFPHLEVKCKEPHTCQLCACTHGCTSQVCSGTEKKEKQHYTPVCDCGLIHSFSFKTKIIPHYGLMHLRASFPLSVWGWEVMRRKPNLVGSWMLQCDSRSPISNSVQQCARGMEMGFEHVLHKDGGSLQSGEKFEKRDKMHSLGKMGNNG